MGDSKLSWKLQTQPRDMNEWMSEGGRFEIVEKGLCYWLLDNTEERAYRYFRFEKAQEKAEKIIKEDLTTERK